VDVIAARSVKEKLKIIFGKPAYQPGKYLSHL
jgi:hypothetical protein